MAEYLREKSGGVIQMKVYPGATPTAGSQKASIEQTQLGTIQGVLYACVFKNRSL
jgi:TRAP-type C4-dicarboxylate transport system substrate-binding protein